VSSPVHSARCLARDARRVEIELGPTGACGAHFPLSRFFALAVLHESATVPLFRTPGVLWRLATPPPLASALTWDDVHDLSCVDRPDPHKDAVTAQFVRDASYRAPRNWHPVLWRADDTGTLRDPDIDRRDPAWRAADDQLQALHRTVADDDLPHLTLRIDVTDERWCAHLVAGMLWDVYAFDYGDLALVV
jgi:hypothetical protein